MDRRPNTKSSLDNFTDEQMQKELEKRQKIKKEQETPQPLRNIDLTPLTNVCKEYIDQIKKDGRADEQMDHWIFEAAMDIVYGHKVWDWIRDQH